MAWSCDRKSYHLLTWQILTVLGIIRSQGRMRPLLCQQNEEFAPTPPRTQQKRQAVMHVLRTHYLHMNKNDRFSAWNEHYGGGQ